jgi:ATP-binding cassette subfamily G (WHITE) protein 2 (PDR)
MYRVSPFTYIVNGMLSTGIANQKVTCADNEYVRFNPPSAETCTSYMQPYISQAGGYLEDPNATTNCGFCTYRDTNVFLSAVSSNYSQRYRNFGILWAFIFVNICGAVFFYWLARVPKNKGKKTK